MSTTQAGKRERVAGAQRAAGAPTARYAAAAAGRGGSQAGCGGGAAARSQTMVYAVEEPAGEYSRGPGPLLTRLAAGEAAALQALCLRSASVHIIYSAREGRGVGGRGVCLLTLEVRVREGGSIGG